MQILNKLIKTFMFLSLLGFISFSNITTAQESVKLITGEGEGWVPLTENDFQNVNTDPDTWEWVNSTIFCKGNPVGITRRKTKYTTFEMVATTIFCKGTPVGVTRSKKKYTNFEMVATWRHMKHAGNSGIFIWASEDGLEGLKPGQLPKAGIEIQILDHGYAENYEKANKKKSDWFTTHGDVFPVGKSKMTPFEPKSPKGNRSFPSKNVSKGVGEWNHYYIKAINGEVRLWVNGEQVSGGKECDPKTGYLCLESEGSPIEFKGLKIKELP